MYVCVCMYVYMYMYIYNYVLRQEHICGRALYKSVIIIIIITYWFELLLLRCSETYWRWPVVDTDLVCMVDRRKCLSSAFVFPAAVFCYT